MSHNAKIRQEQDCMFSQLRRTLDLENRDDFLQWSSINDFILNFTDRCKRAVCFEVAGKGDVYHPFLMNFN